MGLHGGPGTPRGTAPGGAGLVRLSPELLGREGVAVHVPPDTSCLALPGGPGAFVHGGLSPQEAALIFLEVGPGEGKSMASPPVPVRLEAPGEVTSLAFHATVVGRGVERPLEHAPRRVKVVLAGPGGPEAPARDAIELHPTTEDVRVGVDLVAKRAGPHAVSVVDEDTGLTIATGEVTVDVMGSDFDF